MMHLSVEYPSVSELLTRHGLRAKKSFGQNFLASERALINIAEAGMLQADDWVVEIGPGLGSLTAHLCARVPEGRVTCLEKDPEMIAVVRKELGHVPTLTVTEADAMLVDYRALARPGDRRMVVFGNLPYHVASQILFRLCAQRQSFRRVVVMLQKEMADRIVAQPGTKAYGAMGVMLSTFFHAKLVTRVGAGSFMPPPKIDSAVVRLDPLPDDQPRVAIADEVTYRATVHAAFGQRRKMLRNALTALVPAELADRALLQAGIDGTRRGETLSIAEFARVAAGLPRDALAPELIRGDGSDRKHNDGIANQAEDFGGDDEP